MDTTADRVVHALIEEGLLDARTRDRARGLVVRELATQPRPTRRGIPQLVEVVAYVGGALVLGAAALFMFEQWSELGFAARSVMLASATVVLAVAGLVTVRPDSAQVRRRDPGQDVRRRLGGTLLVGAALVAGFLAGHTLDHYTDQGRFPSVYWPVVLAAAVVLVGSVVAYRLAPTALALVGMLGSAVTADLDLLDGLDPGFLGSEGDWIGASLLGLGVLWLVLAEIGAFHEVTTARALGAALALVGAQVPVIDGSHSWLGYTLTAVVVLAGIGLYLSRTAWPYLAVAVLGVTLVVPEAVADWTDGSLGATSGVGVTGLTLLLASFAGYRLRQEKVTHTP